MRDAPGESGGGSDPSQGREPDSRRSVIPDVPRRRRGDPPPSAPRSFRRFAVFVYGGLAVILGATVLVESYLDRREAELIEPRLLEMTASSGEGIGHAEERLRRVKAQAATIHQDFGVQVHFLYQSSRYFPYDMGSMKAAQPPLDDVERLLPFAREFLSHYPKRLIRENLSDIYLTSQLSSYGRGYGGTYEDTSIYVNGADGQYRNGDLHVRGTFHHEFSSILMYRYDFPFDAWQAVNDADFVYPDNSFELLGTAESHAFSETLLRAGFLGGYARSSLENDFNVMASWLFTRRDELHHLARNFDRIDRKMRIARDFYRSVDPAIDLD